MRSLGLRRGDVVFSHSNVGFLGFPEEGNDPETVFGVLLDAFMDVVGPEGTVLIPTFSYSFCKDEDFDIDNTPSSVGAFTEYFRRKPGVVRSLEPIFSIAGTGPKAGMILSDVSNECFGPGSAWERMLQEDAAIVNVGISIGSTFIHYVEQALGVPYRYRKLFTGQYAAYGRSGRMGSVYFVRDLSYPGATPSWKNLEPDARDRGLATVAEVGRGEVSLIRCSDMFDLCRDGLEKNPAYLVEGPLETGRPNIVAVPEDIPALGPQSTMTEMIDAVWDLPRDIVSEGYDRALLALGGVLDMKVHEYPTGTECWTWLIPEKWKCRDAYVETMDGRRVLSYSDSPLHVASYSVPFEGELTRDELLGRIEVRESLPDAVPFGFRYYNRGWGLSCSLKTRDSLKDDRYRVVVDSAFSYGTLKVGEVVAPGKSQRSIVLCAHLCHPAMVNDGLSGVVVGMEVMRRLLSMPGRRYTYRLLILPETIGSLAWLSANEDLIGSLEGGLFLEMLGTDAPHSLQLSYYGNTRMDKCMVSALKANDPDGWVGGYREVICNDERQFNAPGARVPMLSLSRVYPKDSGKWPYPEYHTSLDTPEILSPGRLESSVDMVLRMIDNLERTNYVINKFKGEVFCSKYGIHIDFYKNPKGHAKLFNVMDRIDGTTTVEDIADDCGLTHDECLDVVRTLEARGLVELSDVPIRDGRERDG